MDTQRTDESKTESASKRIQISTRKIDSSKNEKTQVHARTRTYKISPSRIARGNIFYSSLPVGRSERGERDREGSSGAIPLLRRTYDTESIKFFLEKTARRSLSKGVRGGRGNFKGEPEEISSEFLEW